MRKWGADAKHDDDDDVENGDGAGYEEYRDGR